MALWFAKVPAVRQFGSLMIIGIIAVCICSIVLTLAILGIREYRSPTRPGDYGPGRLGRLVVWLSSLSSKTAVPLMAIAAIVLVMGVVIEGKLVVQPDPIQWLNPHSTAVKQIVTLERDTGSDNQIGIVVTTKHPFTKQTVAYVTKLTEIEARKYGSILYPGAGLVSSADGFLTPPGANVVPPTPAQLQEFYRLSPPALKKQLVADNGHALDLVFLSRTNNFAALEPMIENIQTDAPPPPGFSIAPGGIGVVGVGLLENLAKSRVLLTYLALLFVGLFLAVRLRSIVRSLLSLVPVLIAVGTVALLAFAVGVKLSPLTAVSGPLVVAVCTEFTSLILLRFVEERNRGLMPREAMTVTASRTGRAFLGVRHDRRGRHRRRGDVFDADAPRLRHPHGAQRARRIVERVDCPSPHPGLGRRTRVGLAGLLKPVPEPIEFDDVRGIGSLDQERKPFTQTTQHPRVGLWVTNGADREATSAGPTNGHAGELLPSDIPQVRQPASDLWH